MAELGFEPLSLRLQNLSFLHHRLLWPVVVGWLWDDLIYNQVMSRPNHTLKRSNVFSSPTVETDTVRKAPLIL